MYRRLVVALSLLAVAITAVALFPAGVANGVMVPGDAAVEPSAQTTPEGFTNTAFEVRLYENASAKWTVRHSTPLNDSERSQFEDFAERFNSETTDTYADFQVRAQRLTRFGSNATGRQMSATNFQRDARIRELGSQGVIELSFVWTNFSQTTADGVVAGDVFEDGMYIARNQRFVFARGPGLRFTEDGVDPAPDSQDSVENLTASDTVTWFGDDGGRWFADGLPRAVLVQTAEAEPGTGGEPTPGGDTATTGDTLTPTDDTPTTPTATPSPSRASSSGFGPLAFLFAIVVLVGVGGGIAWYSGALPGVLGRGRTGGGATTADAAGQVETTQSEAPVAEKEILSDEDRVIRLLEENGGRMKQVNIVEETDWSKSKVSMLLSDMEDDDDISKLRVGRENIISIRGQEPDAVGSPFDDE